MISRPTHEVFNYFLQKDHTFVSGTRDFSFVSFSTTHILQDILTENWHFGYGY